MAHMVKNLPAVQETWIQSLGQEDPLEKGLATHSSILFFFFNYVFIGCGGSSVIDGLSSCGEQGLLFTAVCGPLIVAASLVAEHRL